jgi:uncharacterized protein (DUF1800 family)
MKKLLVQSFAIKTVAVYALLAGTMPSFAQNSGAVQLTEADARHLLIRTGFAPTQAEVAGIVGQTREAAVSSIITKAKVAKPIAPPPDFVNQGAPVFDRMLKSQEERQAMRQQQLREGAELKAWWLREMVESPTPLAERMTLFWHNHFATSQQKVGRSHAMWNQHQLLRQQALGNFKTLLHGVAKDPAMLVYLDGANSRKEAPNENFAREVMELFTLGEASQGGGYSEQDIKEAARAFTGWGIERDTWAFQFRPGQHDAGSKTILGKTGPFTGEQALDILLEQPQASRYVVGKLWGEFVSPKPDRTEVQRIAATYKNSGYDTAAALRELLLADAFWDDANRGSLVKSPVDLVVGTVRQFDFNYTDAMPFALKTAQLGQNLLVPPNVKGWPGHNEWINATTLLERKRFTEQLFRAVELRAESNMAPIEMGAGGRRTAGEGAGNEGTLLSRMRSEFGAENAGQGRGSVRQSLGLMSRDGLVRVADGVAKISFDPEAFLKPYGGHTDREPQAQTKTKLEQALLAVAPTQQIAPGTVGVAYLRSLTLDPAYQLK